MKNIYRSNIMCPSFSRITCLLKMSRTLGQTRSFCELKTYLSDFGTKYPQKKSEKFWSDFWQKKRLFSEPITTKSTDRPVFSLLLPPPNITGSLHLGHALTLSIEDSLCRYHRMKGHSIRWIPGLDHAGIATQIMVEKLLWTKHKKTRHDFTREEFLAEVEKWKNERSEEIKNQFLRLGVSLDYDKQFYTMSEEMSEAVNEAFVRLFNAGLIYRGTQAVNWCYFMRSAISDIEVEYKQINGPTLMSIPGYDKQYLVGVIDRFSYTIEGTDDVITMATTRLDTILADVAIALHPEDSRFSHLIGKNAIHPLTGRLMPIITDESVRPDFGTGAVKITPALSVFDYAIAEKHSLPIVEIFDESGHLLCEQWPQSDGLHRYDAKDVMRSELQNRGLYVDRSDHKHSLPVCSRTGDIVETRRLPQWFLKCDQQKVMAQFAVNRDSMSEEDIRVWDVLKELLPEEDRHMSIIPPNYRNVWREWFVKPEDWCISRQIYWGHRIPAYKVVINNQTSEEWIAAKSSSEALKIAEKKHPGRQVSVEQDKDVLDTWFSSSLLPLSINGWPKSEVTSSETFPLSLIETGHDIIFFWVARMVLMSLCLTGHLPFRRVLLHGMIGDADGKKMSKSKGNVIDPIDVIDGIELKNMKNKNKELMQSGVLSKSQYELSVKQLKHKFPKGIIECGADALRYYLLGTDFKEDKVVFNINHVITNRNFCNKMHQTVRHFLMNAEKGFETHDIPSIEKHLTPIDRWIISCLVEVVKTCNQSFASYDLQVSAHEIRHFWHNLLCDIYLEHIKPTVYDMSEENRIQRNSVLNVLKTCITVSLRAIHPFMPYISENLWQHIRYSLNPTLTEQSFKSICDEDYPDFESDQWMAFFDYEVKREMNLISNVVQKVRWFKQYFQIPKELFTSDILIATYGYKLEKYKDLIRNSSKVTNGIKFVSIHDIHRYDNHLCYKINLNTNQSNDSDSESDTSDQTVAEVKNSFNDCYILFDIDLETLITSMSNSGLRSELIEQKSNELNQYKCSNFHKNFWRTKSIRQSIN